MPGDKLQITDNATGAVHEIEYTGAPPSDAEIKVILSQMRLGGPAKPLTPPAKAQAPSASPFPVLPKKPIHMATDAELVNEMKQAGRDHGIPVSAWDSMGPFGRSMGRDISRAKNSGSPVGRFLGNAFEDAGGMIKGGIGLLGNVADTVSGSEGADRATRGAAFALSPVDRARFEAQANEQADQVQNAVGPLAAVPAGVLDTVRVPSEWAGAALGQRAASFDRNRPDLAREQMGRMASQTVAGGVDDAARFITEHPVQTALLAADVGALGLNKLAGGIAARRSAGVLLAEGIQPAANGLLETRVTMRDVTGLDTPVPVASPLPSSALVAPPVPPPPGAPARSYVPDYARRPDGLDAPPAAPVVPVVPAPVAPAPISSRGPALPPGAPRPALPPPRAILPGASQSASRLAGPAPVAPIRNTFAEPGAAKGAATGNQAVNGLRDGAVTLSQKGGSGALVPSLTPPLSRMARAGVIAKKTGAVALDAARIPNTLKTAYDLSAPARQAGPLSVGRPVAAVAAARDMFKSLASADSYKAAQAAIARHPDAALYKSSGLDLTGLNGDSAAHLTLAEEAYMSRAASHIPGVKASERAYTAYLNKIRSETFTSIVNGFRHQKMTAAEWENLTRATARYVNTASGRGDLGAFQKAAENLNGIVWSPKFLKSRLDLMNPAFYKSLPPAVRRQAWRDMAALSTAWGATHMAAHLSGYADVTFDPRSTKFGKMVFKNRQTPDGRDSETQLDMSAGFVPFARVLARGVTGTMVDSGGNEKPTDYRGETMRFAEQRSTPIVGLMADALRGYLDKDKGGFVDMFGEEQTPTDETIKLLAPMYVKDMYDALTADPKNAAKVAVPALLGSSAATYEKEKKKGNTGGGPTFQPRRTPPGLDE